MDPCILYRYNQTRQKSCLFIPLATGQRIQIHQALRVDTMEISRSSYKFKIENRDLKQGRQCCKPEIIALKAFPADKRICVYHYLTSYLKRTSDLRGKEQKRLLTGRKLYHAPSEDAFSRRVREFLRKSGVDTTVFVPGRTRAAVTSKALAMGAGFDEVLKAAGGPARPPFRIGIIAP